MNVKDLKTLLCTTGYPVAYDSFKGKPQTPPFIVYRVIGSNNAKADNVIRYEQPIVMIELYTNRYDIDSEDKIKNVLKNNDIEYDYDIVGFIAEENLYEVVFTIVI